MAGGGVGEAMLIGAAVGATAGGAGAAIQGGDPLKGALMGGAMGAVGGGISGAAGGAGSLAAESSTSLVPGAVAETAGTAGTATAAGTGATGASSSGFGLTGASGTGSIYGGAGQGITNATQLGSSISGAGTSGGYGLTAGSGAGSTGMGISAGTAPGAGGGAAGANLGIAQGSAIPAGGYTATGSLPASAGPGNFTGYAPQLSNTQLGMTAATTGLAGAMQAERDQFNQPDVSDSDNPLSRLKYDPNKFTASTPTYAPDSVYRPKYAAEGGIMKLAQGGMSRPNPGPVEQMSQNMMGGQSNMFPQSQQEHTNFAVPTQMPASAEIIRSGYEAKTDPYSGVPTASMARGGEVKGYAAGGLPDLGPGFSWGGMQGYTGTQAQEQAAIAANQAAGVSNVGGMAPNWALSSTTNEQPTGLSAYTSGQGAQRNSGFGSSLGGGGGSSNAFPLQGQYGIVKMANGGVARFDIGGAAMLGVPSDGANAGAQAMADQGIAALGQAGKKRMMTKEQMDAIKMQGMTKAGLQDVYGQMAAQGLAKGGHLGGYSDGGRMLKGPGDGMSDNIPATIAGKQPARLADGEFVVPADVVSHLGNGSTDAGAKQLYAMMNRVRKARTGNSKQGKQIKPAKFMAA